MTLRLDVSLPNGTTGFDEYSGFYISPPDQYNFNVNRRINSGGMSYYWLLSNTGNNLDMNHQAFSAYDRDVDNRYYNCAGRYGGGWWFNGCFHTILNGPYTSGYFYYSSFTQHQRLKTSKMMFRMRSSD
ncbi:techylectin-5B-like [Mya arenaria]|uniref:techylectin-5B-like n=1 Tax=Mya arenaria TaxID=6604 RepID=UPI0022DFAE50|nr:techylectin-5B-like [Mya arenaria]